MTTTAPDFGTDLSATDDVTDDMAEVSGITVVAQAIYRRLSTPRQSLWRDPNYGLDLRLFLSVAQTPAQIASIPGQVKSEILKDERIESVVVAVQSISLFELVIDVSVTTAAGPFSLTLSATQAAVVLTNVKTGGA